jgi:hypothetical protein
MMAYKVQEHSYELCKKQHAGFLNKRLGDGYLSNSRGKFGRIGKSQETGRPFQ